MQRRPARSALFAPFSLFALLCSAPNLHAQADGAAIFEEECSDCHTIGGGSDGAPDLLDVTERRDRDWLLKFIKSPEELIASGDALANAAYVYFDESDMPDSELSDAEIEAVLAHIERTSLELSGDAGSARSSRAGYTSDEDAAKDGALLFQGLHRFANGGVPCNACHDIGRTGVIGGGSLAKDLTAASAKSAAALAAFVDQAPFPVMRLAYQDKPLNSAESYAVVAFLRQKEGAGAAPRDYAGQMAVGGVVGLVLVYGLCGLLWRGRKRGSVYQEIYDRQMPAVK